VFISTERERERKIGRNIDVWILGIYAAKLFAILAP
jgi:hypothetical protein